MPFEGLQDSLDTTQEDLVLIEELMRDAKTIAAITKILKNR